MAGDERFKPKPGQDAVVDYAKLADELAKKMPKGPTLEEITKALEPLIDKKLEALPKQPTGDQLTAAMMTKMPAFVLEYTDKNDQVVRRTQFEYDSASNVMRAKIAPLTVETYDTAGVLKDSDQYPIPWGIKLKPIVIQPTKGT